MNESFIYLSENTHKFPPSLRFEEVLRSIVSGQIKTLCNVYLCGNLSSISFFISKVAFALSRSSSSSSCCSFASFSTFYYFLPLCKWWTRSCRNNHNCRARRRSFPPLVVLVARKPRIHRWLRTPLREE